MAVGTLPVQLISPVAGRNFTDYHKPTTTRETKTMEMTLHHLEAIIFISPFLGASAKVEA